MEKLERNREMSPELRNAIKSSRYDGNHTIAHLGIKPVDFGPGWAVCEMKITEIHCNPLGSVHGGIIFTFADSVGGTAASARGCWVVTSSSSINFFRAAINEEKLIGEARELKAGKNLMTYDIEITNPKGVLIAKATIEYCSTHVPFGNKELLVQKQSKIK